MTRIAEESRSSRKPIKVVIRDPYFMAATVITRPHLPGAQFLATRSAADLRAATTSLKAQQRTQGVASLARRDMTRFKMRIIARWKEACGPPQEARPLSESR